MRTIRTLTSGDVFSVIDVKGEVEDDRHVFRFPHACATQYAYVHIGSMCVHLDTPVVVRSRGKNGN